MPVQLYLLCNGRINYQLRVYFTLKCNIEKNKKVAFKSCINVDQKLRLFYISRVCLCVFTYKLKPFRILRILNRNNITSS